MRIDPAGEFLMFDPANRSDIDAHRTSCMTQEALSRERRLMSDYDQRNDNDQNQKNASDPVRQEAIHDKRAKIIKKATRLFIKKGYAQTTMRDISKATGINLGNLYNYISSKEDILCLSFETYHDPAIDWFQHEGILDIEDPKEQLQKAVDASAGTPAYVGAGVSMSTGGVWRISGCVFEGNEASHLGGAARIINCSNEEQVDLVGCIFLDNRAADGGAISVTSSTPRIENCVFARNEAVTGGAIYHIGCCSPTPGPLWVNNTFWGNVSEQGGAIHASATSCSPVIVNGVFFHNTPEQITTWTGDDLGSVGHSLVQGGYPGEGNIDGDPLFWDAEGLDLHLAPGSPCIDSADGDPAPPGDFDGNARIDDPAVEDTGDGTPPWVDMGAFERQP